MRIPRTVALGIGSLVGTTLLMPPVRRLLLLGGVMDVPNHRSSHMLPTARGAGIACAIGASGAAVAVRRLAPGTRRALRTSLAMAAVGTIDDFIGLPAPLRLTAQVLAGAALAAAVDSRRRTMLLGAMSMPTLVNAVNFMDGINGITGATVAAWAASSLVAPSAGVSTDLAALTGGSAVAFLPWNLPHAQMFLGDSGSYFYGAAMASSVICSTGRARFYAVAPLIPYLYDTAYTLVRRAASGAPLLDAHREHLYQRLQAAMSLPHAAVAVGYGSAALALGVGFRSGPWPVVAVVALVILATYAVVVEKVQNSGRVMPTDQPQRLVT